MYVCQKDLHVRSDYISTTQLDNRLVHFSLYLCLLYPQFPRLSTTPCSPASHQHIHTHMTARTNMRNAASCGWPTGHALTQQLVTKCMFRPCKQQQGTSQIVCSDKQTPQRYPSSVHTRSWTPWLRLWTSSEIGIMSRL